MVKFRLIAIHLQRISEKTEPAYESKCMGTIKRSLIDNNFHLWQHFWYFLFSLFPSYIFWFFLCILEFSWPLIEFLVYFLSCYFFFCCKLYYCQVVVGYVVDVQNFVWCCSCSQLGKPRVKIWFRPSKTDILKLLIYFYKIKSWSFLIIKWSHPFKFTQPA